MVNNKRAATYHPEEEPVQTDLTVHFGKPRAELVLHYPNGMRGVYEAPEVDVSTGYPEVAESAELLKKPEPEIKVEFRLYGEWSGVVVAEEQ